MKPAIILACLLGLSGCAASQPPIEPSIKKSYHGHATWYQDGKRTADGQRFNPDKYSVAHRTLPFGTMLRLTNVNNGSTIEAVVNDRGPFIKGREVDVSRGGAKALGFFHSGTARLLIEVLDRRKTGE
jgi:rare lipoprotein A